MTDFSINSAVLYRAGIGWFLATGKTESGSIYFPVAKKDLDDFLKTSIVSVNKGSGFKNLSFDTTEREHIFDFTDAFTGLLEFLRGSDCAITYGDKTITGKILGYQHLDEKGKQMVVSVLDDEGIVNLDPHKIGKIVPKNDNLKEKLQEFLAGMVADSDIVEQKMLRIGLESDQSQDVFVQFLTEVPAWKLSYRLIIEEEKSVLQMYAIVDNTTLVDFIDANLTLSTKLPVSFRYDLSTPHLMTRQKIERTSETGITVDRKSSTRSGGGVSAKKMMAARSFADSEGFGAGEIVDDGLGTLLGKADFSSQAEIEATGSVEFVLKTPVTIRKNESSMVPLTEIDVDVNQKHYFNSNNHKLHPFKIIEFKNTKDYSIDEGPISVLEDGKPLPLYQGEAMLNRIPTGDEALILYSLDRDVEIRQSVNSRTKDVGFEIKGYYYKRELKKYLIYKFEVTNSTPDEVSIYFSIPKSRYEFTDKVEFRDSLNEFRVVASIAPQSTNIFEYEMAYTDYINTGLMNYSLKDLNGFLDKLDISADEKKRVKEIINYKNKLDELQQELQDTNKRIDRLSQRRDQVISSLKVLEEGTSDQKVRSEYVTSLTEIDKELNELNRNIEKIEEKISEHKSKKF